MQICRNNLKNPLKSLEFCLCEREKEQSRSVMRTNSVVTLIFCLQLVFKLYEKKVDQSSIAPHLLTDDYCSSACLFACIMQFHRCFGYSGMLDTPPHSASRCKTAAYNRKVLPRKKKRCSLVKKTLRWNNVCQLLQKWWYF